MKFTLLKIRRLEEPLARLSNLALSTKIVYWLARDIKIIAALLATG